MSISRYCRILAGMETSTSQLYEDIAGVAAPWVVTAVIKDDGERKITIRIEHGYFHHLPGRANLYYFVNFFSEKLRKSHITYLYMHQSHLRV
jgi:hypothetical protein